MKKILLTLTLVTLSVAAYAQGTINFGNTIASKVQYQASPGGPIAEMPATAPVVFGVFWGTTADGLQVDSRLGVPTAAGVFSGGAIFGLPGTQPGDVVFMKIAGWDAANGINFDASKRGPGHYGETDVRQVTLAATAGPGQVIFQGSTGTNPNRFKAFTIFAVVPEPSVIALGTLGLGALLLRRRKV
jgi:hypothetical protein